MSCQFVRINPNLKYCFLISRNSNFDWFLPADMMRKRSFKLGTSLALSTYLGPPQLARPPRPCLDFGFQYALIRNNRSKKNGVEYWALPCSNSPWRLCSLYIYFLKLIYKDASHFSENSYRKVRNRSTSLLVGLKKLNSRPFYCSRL